MERHSRMKTDLIRNGIRAAMAAAALQLALPACADDAKAAKEDAKARSWNGTVTAVDPKGRTVTVKRFLFAKTFSMAESCDITVGNHKQAQADELHPGMKVGVRYAETQGVPIASALHQKQEKLRGTITAIDADSRAIKVGQGMWAKQFTAPEDCVFEFHKGSTGAISDLRLGQRVTVTYGQTGETLTAYRVLEPSEMFAGTLSAVDATERTIRVKYLLGEKRFRLADDCHVLVGDTLKEDLAGLQLGQKISLDYQEANGVLIASRLVITDADAKIAEAKTASSSRDMVKQTEPQD